MCVSQCWHLGGAHYAHGYVAGEKKYAIMQHPSLLHEKALQLQDMSCVETQEGTHSTGCVRAPTPIAALDPASPYRKVQPPLLPA